MTQEEIIEGNKLIAEFMELEFSKVAKGLPDIKYRHRFTQHGFYDETHEGMLLFHSSWDWLMPIVEKIENIFILHKYSVTIAIESDIPVIITVHFYQSDPTKQRLYKQFRGISPNRIEAVYKTVVEFIKWYNKQEK